MQSLNYLCPESLDEALALLHQYPGQLRPYAGGTDLMVHLRERAKELKAVEGLLDLQKLPQLRGITAQNGQIRLGAMETHTAVATSALLQREARFLSLASSQVGSPQIRNRGTIGGNVANASAAADTISALAALDAQAQVASVRGVRTVPLQELYTPKGKSALAADELIVCFTFAGLGTWRTAFCKLGRRKALAISRLNAAVALQVEDGKILQARIAPGCVFAVPGRVASAEALLLGQAGSEALFQAAAEETAQEMIRRTGVRWSTAYKEPALTAVIQQTLQEAWEQ